MESSKIVFEGVEYNIKQSFRALMMFEELAGKEASKANDSVTDLLKMFYCILKASNSNSFTYTFDKFIDLIDTNLLAVSEFTNYLTSGNVVEPTKKKIRKL